MGGPFVVSVGLIRHTQQIGGLADFFLFCLLEGLRSVCQKEQLISFCNFFFSLSPLADILCRGMNQMLP